MNNEERLKGKWIMISNFDGNLKCYRCSNCGKTQGYISHYCEDCGTDMNDELEIRVENLLRLCDQLEEDNGQTHIHISDVRLLLKGANK